VRAAQWQLAQWLAALIVPPSRDLPSSWVADHIWLPPGKNETEPGKVSWHERPYLREPLDRMADPSATDVVFVAPTRDGKTFLLRMAFAYTVAGDPAAALWYDSSESKARGISIKELQPLVDHNSVLSSRKPRNHHHYTNTLMMFAGAPFQMFGASTAGQAAGDTAMRLFGNEVEKWGDATDKEASLVELVRHRTESFESERFHMFSSTPTLETGPIWLLYEQGDQRQWRALCPDCGCAQELVWDQVRWDPAAQISEHQWNLQMVKASARYHCIDCNSAWTDSMRRLAVQNPQAHWHPRNTGSAVPGMYSYHLNGLYGPKEKNSPGALAVDFLVTRKAGFYKDRQDFWNSRMGMPWRDDVSKLTHTKFAAREAQCLRGEVPTDMNGDVLIIGADVQTYGMPWVAEICDWSGRYHTVDHGLAATWSDIESVQTTLSHRFKTKSYVIIDINFEERRTETLEQIHRRLALGWIGAEGYDYSKEMVRIEKANVYMGGRLQATQVLAPKLCISTYEFKVELEKAVSGEMRNWTTYQLPMVATPAEEREQKEFYDQLLDERRMPRKRKTAGKPPFEFVSRNGNNHYWDCKVYIRALFFSLAKRRAHSPKEETKRTSMEITRQ